AAISVSPGSFSPGAISPAAMARSRSSAMRRHNVTPAAGARAVTALSRAFAIEIGPGRHEKVTGLKLSSTIDNLSIDANPRDVAAGRRTAMAVLAQAGTDEIAAAFATLGPTPAHEEVRPAEIGLVMVRGRIGGDGAPFNLGEATVTRCAVQLASGEIGFGTVLGRG